MVEGSGVLSAKEFAKQAHATEEECLFFVAVSRAQKHLHLYLPRKQPNGNNRSESRFLNWLLPQLVTKIDNPDQLSGPSISNDPNIIEVNWTDSWRMTESRLTAYERCPRRFFHACYGPWQRPQDDSIFKNP